MWEIFKMMNKTLEDMMLQATEDIPEGYYVPPQYFEKFAELIIQECLTISDTHYNPEWVILDRFGMDYIRRK